MLGAVRAGIVGTFELGTGLHRDFDAFLIIPDLFIDISILHSPE